MAAVSVTYERKLSDGKYGTEGFTLTMTGGVVGDGPLEQGQYIDGLLASARSAVLEKLAQSGRQEVAWAAMQEIDAVGRHNRRVTPTPGAPPPRVDPEDEAM
jgi:hypothetical protein